MTIEIGSITPNVPTVQVYNTDTNRFLEDFDRAKTSGSLEDLEALFRNLALILRFYESQSGGIGTPGGALTIPGNSELAEAVRAKNSELGVLFDNYFYLRSKVDTGATLSSEAKWLTDMYTSGLRHVSSIQHSIIYSGAAEKHPEAFPDYAAVGGAGWLYAYWEGVDGVSASKARDKLLNDLQAIGQTYGDPSVILRFMNDLEALPSAVLQNQAIQKLLQVYERYLAPMAEILFQVNSFSSNNSWEQDYTWLVTMENKFKDIPAIANEFRRWQDDGNLSYFRMATTLWDGSDTRIWRERIDGIKWSEHQTDSYGGVFQNSEYRRTNDYGGLVYTWEKDKDLITALISNGQFSGDTDVKTNPFLNLSKEVSADIRNDYVEKMDKASLAEAFMLLMQMFDKVNANQQAGLSISTEILNKVTNSIATPLLNLVQKMGTQSFSQQDTEEFIRVIWVTERLAQVVPQFSRIAGNLTGAIKILREVEMTGPFQIPTGGSLKTTIGNQIDLMRNWVSSGTVDSYDAGRLIAEMTVGLRNLQANQTLISSAQQIGALFTGESKQVSTQFSITANELNQILQLGSSVTSEKSGYQSMIQSMIRAQRAN